MHAPGVVVVGAGIGGLASAALLAARGVAVTVLERAAAPGGKLRQVSVAGAAIDAGPTVFTMRWILEQIFAEAGASFADELTVTPLDVLARHAWDHGGRLDLFADVQRSADAVGSFAGAAEAQRFVGFCAEARRVYQALVDPYIRAQRPNLLSMMTRLGPGGHATLLQLGLFRSLWHRLGHHFHDARLRQLFGRYATYCGSSPWQAPATLLLVAHVELDGVWAIDGGMHALAQSLVRLIQRNGGRVRTGCEVGSIEVKQGAACGVRLADGELIGADAIVFNGDVNALASGLLGAPARRAVDPVPRSKRSLSALTWSIHARTAGLPLTRHNVFFTDRYDEEFADIFARGRLPRAPTVYVCAQDRANAGLGLPHSAERLLLIVNAPASGDRGVPAATEIAACEASVFGLLERCGLTIDRSAANTVLTTPTDFERLFPGTGGALYGRASHGWLASFDRPASNSRIAGLFLAGGSVHPGPGVPMAAMSGRLAAASTLTYLAAKGRASSFAMAGSQPPC